MKTKAELEQQVMALKAQVERQYETIRRLSGDEGIVVQFSGDAFAGFAAPYVKADGKDAWRDGVMPVIARVIREHGIPHNPVDGFACEPRLDLGRGIYGRMDSFVVPRVAGLMLIDLINAAADFGRKCYAQGVQVGSDVLAQLARGEISQDEYEDRIAREKAQDMQAHRKARLNSLNEV
jgi:hypothetical protein